MGKIYKKRKKILSNFDNKKFYNIKDAIDILYNINNTNFDASIDIHLRINIDINKSINTFKGFIILPHSNGHKNKILALCDKNDINLCLNAGAEFAGLEEYISKIENKWFDFNYIVVNKKNFAKITHLSSILGPRGLMPSVHLGTITDDIKEEICNIKKGKIVFKIDKGGIFHIPIGKLSLSYKYVYENAIFIIQEIINIFSNKIKKRPYYKSIFLASTMGPSIQIDTKTIL